MTSAVAMGNQVLTELRKARVRQEISTSELARRIGAARGSFAMMENGHHMPTFNTLMRWAAELGVVIRADHETGAAE